MADPPDRIDDPDAPASEAERAAAERLRDALEAPPLDGRPAETNDDAELARALVSAWSPRDLPDDVHKALVSRALATATATAARRNARRSRVIRLSFAATGALAAAAALVLVLRGDRSTPDVAAVAATAAVSRSTQPLFRDPFPTRGGETSRIDRIAMARAADLRENEFARWGVR
jgi:hypothetical protein